MDSDHYDIEELEDSEDIKREGFPEDDEHMDGDWYHASDTDEDIPDPNNQKEALFQKANTLPVILSKKHFQEGLLYTMVLEQGHDKPMLVMIIAKGDMEFTYQLLLFFARVSAMKTFHEAGSDKTAKYQDVWRLALRSELLKPVEISSICLGQTLRVSHGMNEDWDTVVVTKVLSSKLIGLIQCGNDRGSTREFEKSEIVCCQEVFGSPLLHNLRKELQKLLWKRDNRSKTRDIPQRTPKLCSDFVVPADEEFKRKWHFMKLLGEAE